MDLGTIIGLSLATGCVMYAILLGGSLLIFYDLPSVICVGGGVLAAVFIKWPLEDVKSVGKIFMKSIFYASADSKATIEKLQELAEMARRESVFALEKVELPDKFLKKAVQLAADNRPPDIIASILNLEIESMEDRHNRGIAILDGIGADGPAFGMIGTLIGLVQMLQNLSDPSSIGPAMAVALLTTFYGSILANIFAIPVANKLKTRHVMEKTKMTIIIAGVMGIVAGENPRVIREKLDSFLPPSERPKVEEKA